MGGSARSLFPLRFPVWQTQYEAALMETNSDRLPKFVAAAELAILSRLQVLLGEVGHEQERIALSDAQRALRFLKGSTSPK
jgi:hypothetical protein